MKIQLRPLFSVEVTHSYYGGRCSDFEFVTLPATAQSFRDGKLLARTQDGQLQVWYESDSGNLPVSRFSGIELFFGMRLSNAVFSYFSKPVVSQSLRPFYGNLKQTDALDSSPIGVKLVSGIYSHTVRSAVRPVICTLLDQNENVLQTVRLESDDTSVAFDFRTIPMGLYSLREMVNNEPPQFTELLIGAEFQHSGLWGFVSIRVDDAFYTTAPKFAIQFEALEEKYQYYVVARHFDVLDVDNFVVADGDKAESDPARVQFEKVTADDFGDSEIPPSMLGNDTDLILLFRSQRALPRRAQGYRRWTLKLGGIVLLDNLPQPAADRPKAEFVIHVSKPQGSNP